MAFARSLRAALVTGASQGIGKAIAMRLASDGYKVALNDIPRKREQLEAVAKDIDKKYGQGSFVVPADVSQEEEVKQMVDSSSKAFNGLDVVVANAAIIGPAKPMIEISMEEWDKVQQINIRGVFMCYKWAAKDMIDRGRGGRIIGASSLAGKQGSPNVTPYVTSKFGVRGLTQAAALELGRHGITVNAYAPGAIETPMVEQLFAEPEGHQMMQEGLEQLKRLHAKPGQPDDIASIVSYLASKEAYYITGQTISVNAGMYFD
ncbi:hypothetical protein GYMLUDRAFT_45011 [Collybiopsis luxurians FD-317 M1]|uniref:Diacetyl reductase ((S)-acetoin forming) n=1 Tax=Collybiopsis luxurians FD-317 M1 TaxID=944289 RepID=A0A0D0BU55_9AGAR|nr:hypothetical protein GYMLUDRAFT_45011 [Collybiopsis luxurians FD-317 M1]